MKEDEEVTVRLVIDTGYAGCLHEEEVIMLRSQWLNMSSQERCQMAEEEMSGYIDYYAELVED